MRTVTISWQPELGRFDATGKHAAFPIPVNAPHAGEAAGFSPAELLLAGAGACAAWDVVEILHKARQPLEALEVAVNGVQDEAAPHAFTDVELAFTARGPGLDRARVERAVALSMERYCSVVATIRGVAQVGTRVEVLDTTARPASPSTPAPTRPRPSA